MVKPEPVDRPIDRLDPSWSGKPVYEAPDYSRYEFTWEPGKIFVHWELNEKTNLLSSGAPGKRNVTYGRALTLSKARINAFRAMALDAAPDVEDAPVGGFEDGNELMRTVGKDPRDPVEPV